MDTIVHNVDFQTQLSSIMDMLAKTAVVEIGKLFEENSSLLRIEISRRTLENESLKQKCFFLENELQAARRTAAKINGTTDSSSGGHTTHTDNGHCPTIDTVFGKEWCINLWRHEESNVEQKKDTHLSSLVITGESVNLLKDDPDIMIKEETFEDCSGKNKFVEDQSLSGPAVSSSDGYAALSSDDFIMYTVSSDDEVQMNIQQRQTETQTLDQRPFTHGDSLTESNLNPEEFVDFFPSNENSNTTQNQTTVPEEKKIECGFCGKAFNYLRYLKVHMRTHTGEKPFVCTVCGKRFAQKNYLRIHQRIHSGERPYTCMECGKKFSQKSSLNVHLRCHTGVKPYSCTECGKSYTNKHGFNAHHCIS